MPPAIPPTAAKSCVSPGNRTSPSIPRTIALLLCALGTLAISLSPARADLIAWGTQGFLRQTDSHGNDWTHPLELRLGVFSNGFIPSPHNLDQWAAHWTTLDTATYYPEENRHAGLVDDASPLPNKSSPTVYVWALNGEDLTRGPEWMLFTHPSWLWTARTSNPPAPIRTWIADEAATAILGQIANSQIHLASVAVRPPEISITDWLASFGITDLLPDADPDNDGLSNQTEYLLGSNPSLPSSLTSPQIRIESGNVRLSLNRNPYAISTFVLETSTDLKRWTPATPQILADRPDLIEVASPAKRGAASLFYRFQLHTHPVD